MFSAKANDRLGRVIGIRSSEQGHRSVKPCKLSIGGGRVVAFFVEGAIRSERSGQFIPKEGEACLRISLKVSSRLDGNPSAIVNLFHQLKEPPVFRVLRGTPGPKPAMGIGEVKMDNLLASAPDDLRILIHHPQVIVIDDHPNAGAMDLMHQAQRLRAGINDVAFLGSQRLNGNGNPLRSRNFIGQPEKRLNLLPGLLARKSRRHVPRTGASPDYNRAAQLPAAFQGQLHVIPKCLRIDVISNHTQAANESVKAFAANRRALHLLFEARKCLFTHGGNFRDRGFQIVESIGNSLGKILSSAAYADFNLTYASPGRDGRCDGETPHPLTSRNFHWIPWFCSPETGDRPVQRQLQEMATDEYNQNSRGSVKDV